MYTEEMSYSDKDITQYVKKMGYFDTMYDGYGVYAVCLFGRVLYIGKSKQLERRICEHCGYIWNRDFVDHDKIAKGSLAMYKLLNKCTPLVKCGIEIKPIYMGCTKRETDIMEKTYIDMYKPPFNLVGTDRKEPMIHNLDELRDYLCTENVFTPVYGNESKWIHVDMDDALPMDLSDRDNMDWM